jgi:glycosyltransferase involved in cell wall biosynthesis
MPLFSIIIPVYNVENYLCSCIESVISQTFTGYECILVDDGSPDNCPVLCDDYAARESRFRVIHKENGGLSDARNTGILAATGDYLVFLDSDDTLASNRALEKLSEIIGALWPAVVFNSHAELINGDSARVVDSVKNSIVSLKIEQFYKNIMSNKNNLFTPCLFVVQRNFLIQRQLFFKKGILHEDELWMPCLVCSVDSIIVNHGLFYSYKRGRTNSITSSVSSKNLFDKIAIIEELKNRIKCNMYKI